MPMAQQPSKIFFPNLDGLRFIAFFTVFVHHTLNVQCFSSDPQSEVYRFVFAQKLNGALGVNLFFVLSGFLITYLLISEKQRFGRINVPHFYMRRILRIWPMYFLVVVAGFVLFPLLKKMMGDVPNESHGVGWYLFFVSNFEMIRKGFADSSLLNVLWSVGVEEQFYLAWPLIMTLSPRRHLAKVLGLLVAATVVFRSLHAAEGQVIYYHTLAVIGDMAIGGLVAYAAFNHPPFVRALANMPKRLIVAIYAIGFGLILFNYKIFTTPAMAVMERYVYALFFAFVIAEQNYAQHSPFKMANSKWMSRWGNYTYGLYCLHSAAILVAHILSEKLLHLHNPWLVMGIDATVGLGLSLAMAWVSYRYFETPFLKLKDKFAYFVK
jgi:peptidoglycan/LPS O-acetylase OafA/YrhL